MQVVRFSQAGTAGLPHEGQAAARSVSHVDIDRRFFCAQHTLPITAVRNGKWYHSGEILGPPASIPTSGILVNSENKQNKWSSNDTCEQVALYLHRHKVYCVWRSSFCSAQWPCVELKQKASRRCISITIWSPRLSPFEGGR